MLTKWQFNVLMVFSAFALMLVVFNIVVAMQNREAQMQLIKRQQFVQQTVPLETLYREIVKALAEMAVKTNDQQVVDMLATQGLNIAVNGPAGAVQVVPAKKADQ